MNFFFCLKIVTIHFLTPNSTWNHHYYVAIDVNRIEYYVMKQLCILASYVMCFSKLTDTLVQCSYVVLLYAQGYSTKHLAN